jgi:hypothetical protein
VVPEECDPSDHATASIVEVDVLLAVSALGYMPLHTLKSHGMVATVGLCCVACNTTGNDRKDPIDCSMQRHHD